MKKEKKVLSKTKKGVIVGSAIVASVGAIAGAYLLFGTKKGKEKTKKIKGWMLKAKGEILEKIESVQDISEEGYKTAVDSVMKKYSNLKEKYGPEVNSFYSELLSHWKDISKKGAKKTVKKASKKIKVAKVK